VPGTFCIKTLGCKLNQVESALMAEPFLRAGWKAVDFGQKADLVIVNTCTVTDRSDKKSRNCIRQASRYARTGRAVVTGCLADRDRDTVEAMPEVMAVYGNRDKPLIEKQLAALTEPQTREGSPFPDNAESGFIRTRGYLKIQDGCHGSCAYCVVPAVRGAPRSEPAERVVRQARHLIHTGCPELILTGITIGHYRDAEIDLVGLVQALVALPGRFRLRLTSVEPLHVDDRLISLLEHERVCSHIHLPLQSGSDTILASMRRSYGMEQYIELVERIRDRLPDIAIGTDLMVGFPGEEEQEFDDTLQAVERIGFAYVHQFTFSARSGTPAADIGQTVPADRVADRVRRLRELGLRKALDYRERFLGRTLTCVIQSNANGRGFTAVSDNYIKIALIDSPLNKEREGTLSPVELLHVDRSSSAGRSSGVVR
jgi:threonylcarbamoyladenosine tRNA methylthiotransferase MtaB